MDIFVNFPIVSPYRLTLSKLPQSRGNFDRVVDIKYLEIILIMMLKVNCSERDIDFSAYISKACGLIFHYRSNTNTNDPKSCQSYPG